MSNSTNLRNVLNEKDIRAQKNLQKIWKAYKAVHKINQTDFAEDKLRWTQGNFSQYLTGQVRIGDKALAKLCEALEVNPWDIREELKDVETATQLNQYKTAFETLEQYVLSLKNPPKDLLAAYEDALSQVSGAEDAEDNIAA